MRFATDRVLVKVPASSANLGAGFDCLNLALDLWDQVEAKAVAGASRVKVTGEGAGSVPTDGSHLVVRAARRALEVAGAPIVGLELDCVNAIPHGRGLGSSAAAAAAGCLIARGLIAHPAAMDADGALQVTTDFEGHPDNAAATVFGGASIAWLEEGRARAVPLRVDPRIAPVVLVPRGSVTTKKARAVLPDRVPHRDAAFNAARAALMVHALTKDPDLLFEASEDRLHQPYRAKVMAPTAELVAELRAKSMPAMVSGAGPSVIVLTADPDSVPSPKGWRRLRLDIPEAGGTVTRLT
jgi:homoserine kinase